MTARKWHSITVVVEDVSAAADAIVRATYRHFSSSQAPDPKFYFDRGLGQTAPGSSIVVRAYVGRSEAQDLLYTLSQSIGAVNQTVSLTVDIGDTDLSPLWNAGFAGSSFAQVSRALCCDASDLLGRALTNDSESLRSPGQALSLLVTHGFAVVRSIASSVSVSNSDLKLLISRFASYRSHAEGYYFRQQDPEAIRLNLERKYVSISPGIEELLSTDHYALSRKSELGATQLASAWSKIVEKWHVPLREAFSTGDIYLEQDAPDESQRMEIGDLKNSPFHGYLDYTPALDYYLNQQPDLLAARLLTSLLYHTHYVAGNDLNARYPLCYLASRAAEEYFDVTTDDSLDALADVSEQFWLQSGR